MGLAASQARFLNLVARKTNLEFEGQQINQQRTTLANQSANTYTSMLNLQVPTPPSTDAFKRTVYTVNFAGQEYTISQMVKSANGKCSIGYTTLGTELRLVEEDQTRTMTETTNNDTLSFTYKGESKSFYLDGKPVSLVKDADFFDEETKEILLAEFGNNALYTNVSTNGTSEYVYYTPSDLIAPFSSTPCEITCHAFKEFDNILKEGAWSDATITRDANNRIAAISSPELADGAKLAVKSTVVVDELAYEAAYDEYTYQTYLYKQQLDNINAQTAALQAKDKKLELRLKQLDTEQSAIKTEMDSISGVIDKNVDETFKIFA